MPITYKILKFAYQKTYLYFKTTTPNTSTLLTKVLCVCICDTCSMEVAYKNEPKRQMSSRGSEWKKFARAYMR